MKLDCYLSLRRPTAVFKGGERGHGLQGGAEGHTQYVHIYTDTTGSDEAEGEGHGEEVWRRITYTDPSAGRFLPLHLTKGVTSLSCWGEERDWLLVWS